jgi:hypothetical protein
MTNGFKSVRNAVLIGLAWAVVWAPIALVIGITLIDPDNSMDEMWPVIGAYPGFLSAVLFCTLVAIAERRHGLAEISLPRAASWGALSGLIVGLLPFLVGTANPQAPNWLPAAIIGSIALMSVLSAIATTMFARTKQKTAVRV